MKTTSPTFNVYGKNFQTMGTWHYGLYCNGTNDEVQLLRAINTLSTLGGGTVCIYGTLYLAPTTSYGILPKSNVDIIGGDRAEIQINATNMVAATAPNDWKNRIIGVRIDSISNCTIRNLTLRLTGTPSDLNYTARFIGTSDETVQLRDLLIYNDTTGAGTVGDALHFGYQTTSKAINCRAYSSTKSHSGGIVIGGNASNFPKPTLVDCYGKTRASGALYAAGIWVDFASPTIINSIGQGSADEDSYGIFVHHIDSKAQFIGCIGYSGDRVDNCGFYLDMQASPTLIGCVGVCEGAGYYAWAFASTAAPILIGCVAEYGDTASRVGYYIIENAAPKILSSTVKLAGDNYAWEYDDANSGRFQPYAATHYQLINIAVEVVNGNSGQTLNIGTAADGSQIASVNIAVAGHQQIDLGTKLRFASGAYMFASVTPGTIADGDVIVQYEVVKDLGGCNAVQLNSKGPALIEGCAFYGTDGDDVINIGANAGTDYKFIRNHIENYTPASNAINCTSATTNLPFYDNTIIGALTNVVSLDVPTLVRGETRTFIAQVNYNASSPVTLFTVEDGYAITDVWVEIVTAFAGTSPTLDIGDGTDADGFLANANITETATGYYGLNEDERGAFLWDAANSHRITKVYTATDTVDCTIGGTSLTAGQALVYAKVVKIGG